MYMDDEKSRQSRASICIPNLQQKTKLRDLVSIDQQTKKLLGFFK